MSGPSADAAKLRDRLCAICTNDPTVGIDYARGTLPLCDRCYADFRQDLSQPSADAVRALVDKLLERMQKTCSGENVTFDRLHVEEVLRDALLSAAIPPAPAQALIERLQWARSFIEYARVQLQPGETQPSDPFPRQSAADLAMSEIDGVIDALHSLTIPPEQTKEHGV